MDDGQQGVTPEAAGVAEQDLAGLRREFRALRRARRVSQAEAARFLGVSQATVSAFEQGSYGRIRKGTLAGMWRLVGVWRQAQGEAGPDEALAGREGACGHCHRLLPA